MYNTDQNNVPDTTKVVVTQNPLYDIYYDKHKNRVCLAIKGFWKNKEAVPDYLTDLRKALRLTQPNFTLLTDLQTMLTHPQRLSGLHLEAQTMVQEAGLAKAARVLPKDRIAKLQVEEIGSKSPMHSESFLTVAEAELYLSK